MADTSLARFPLPSDLGTARKELTWIADRDLGALTRRDASEAIVLSVFFGGGGHLYVGDTLRGVLLLAADLAAVVLTGVHGMAWPLWLGVGVVASVFSFRKAKAINRYVALRDELAHLRRPLAQAAQAALPALPAGPGEHAPLVERIRKLGALLQTGLITTTEFSERKIELLTSLGTMSRADIDDLLYELLPLYREGLLAEDDVQFIKQLDAQP
jgi:hypothetical protein